MLNLLPKDVKKDITYASKNVTLRYWIGLCLLAYVGLGLISTYGLLSIRQSTVKYNNLIASQGLVATQQEFTQTQKQAKDMSGSFKLVLQVLGKEILFSELLKQIAAIMPANSNLTGLNISKTTGAIDISAIATDYNTATQVQVNLADPANKIFSKADIVNIACGGTSLLDPKYPCTVNIRALFAAKNPFLLINAKAAK